MEKHFPLIIVIACYQNKKSGRLKFCLGKLILESLARIGEWHQNLNEYTVSVNTETGLLIDSVFNRVNIIVNQFQASSYLAKSKIFLAY